MVAQRYSRRITGKAAFVHELTRGNSDMIVIVAHSDGPAIYLGGERVTLKELQQIPRRNSTGARARLALLFSCDTGRLTPQQGGLFRSKMNSLATILVEKRFVDAVIAPDHTINATETIAVLRGLLDGKTATAVRSEHPGGQKLALLGRRRGVA